MSRDQFQTRVIRLVGQAQCRAVAALMDHIPIDAENPIEVVIREPVKARKLDQNALMWRGPLRDIAEQAYVAGRRYSAEAWHEQFKREYLPEEFDEALTKSGYKKWDYTPDGERVLVGSTTQLTVRGFSQYMEQVLAYGAGIGVLFTTMGDK